MNPRPVNVEYISPYKLIITVADVKAKWFDMTPYLHFPVYQPLKDETFLQKSFNTIRNGCLG